MQASETFDPSKILGSNLEEKGRLLPVIYGLDWHVFLNNYSSVSMQSEMPEIGALGYFAIA
ncbi:hypothetical protein KR51_00031070 [Rubidibacter lacunae KORDI 51-2]|uniref:Uncharacterized protein n=1 Tax=Rubidibacter lacunae KORDI 51-2 TaxID=582515 RepID=U5DIZ2_9CHRO|nr:hypothetical protein KR51_00031070 [Rubidibacter lacunae KORDI 51-2]